MIALVMALLLAVPAPSNAPKGLPNVGGVCLWGRVVQQNGKVSIGGRTDWWAEGTVEEGGSP